MQHTPALLLMASTLAAAQNWATDYSLTVPINFPTGFAGNHSYAGRIVQFCGDTTSFVLQCTNTSIAHPCTPSPSSFTVAQSGTFLGITTATVDGSTTTSARTSCVYPSSSSIGTCTATVEKTWGSQTTSTVSTTKLVASQASLYWVAITSDQYNISQGNDANLHCKADTKSAGADVGHVWSMAALVVLAVSSGMMMILL